MSLTSLPIELVNKICRYLEPPEWAALRLSCRSLYAKSLDAYADRYFNSICFIATSEGIRELEELAKNDTFSTHVRQLWMIPTVFEGRHDLELEDSKFRTSGYSERSNPLSRHEDELRACYSIYQTIKADNQALLESSTFSARLHACFTSFRNLGSVGLKHYATSYLLDPRQTEFRCLGLRNLRDQVDYIFKPSNLNHLQWHFPANINSLALSRMLQGYAESNQQIRALNTCGANFCGSTSPYHFLTQEHYTSLLRKLENLEDLHICICYNEKEPSPTSTSTSPSPSATYLDLLISVAPRLKSLYFSQWDRFQRNISESYFLGLAQHINFTRLKELHLHWIQIGSESFKLFMTTAKETLKTLTLNLVYLKEHLLINSESTGWKHVWEFFGEELSLESFYMANIGYDGHKVMIQGPRNSVEPTSSVRFSAEMSSISFNKWIRQLKPIPTGPDSRVRRYPGLYPPKPQTSWKSFLINNC